MFRIENKVHVVYEWLAVSYCNKIGSILHHNGISSTVNSVHTSFMNKMPLLAQISQLLSTNSYDRVRPVISLQYLWTLHVSGIKHKNKIPYLCTMSTSLSRLGDRVWMDRKYTIGVSTIQGVYSIIQNNQTSKSRSCYNTCMIFHCGGVSTRFCYNTKLPVIHIQHVHIWSRWERENNYPPHFITNKAVYF